MTRKEHPDAERRSPNRSTPGDGPTALDDRVAAVGIGPGDPEYLTRLARRSIGGADVVVGFATVVDHVCDLIDGTALSCTYENEARSLERFADRVAGGASGVAVLMGDPNVSGYQFLDKVERAIGRPVRVIPGISSVQVAASRVRVPLEESTIVTLHKRGDLVAERERLIQDLGDRHLIVLPRPFDWMPESIAAHLVDRGADPDLEAVILERLTHRDERITRRSLGELSGTAVDQRSSKSSFSDLSVLVIGRG